MVKKNKINKTNIKKQITAFCNDIFSINFISINYNLYFKRSIKKLVRLLGFEPRTSWSVAKRSIQLSYRRCILGYLTTCINKI